MSIKAKPDHPTLYLIDISSFIFRAFYAIRSLSNSKGEPTNAIYGVASMLAKLIEKAKPEFVTVVYDSKEPSFRKEKFEDYKANRSAPPDDLIPQFDRIEELVKLLGFHSVRQSGIEADDLIGTLAVKWTKANPKNEVVLVTGDKDLMQLVNSQVRVWDTMKEVIYEEPEVEEKFGIKANQVRDYLALVGDSSDNIPGVPSIGPKGAVDLLKEYGTLEGVLEAAQKNLIKGKKGETIKAHIKEALLSQDLATLKIDCEVEVDIAQMRSPFINQIKANDEVFKFLKELELNSIAAKWREGVESNPTRVQRVSSLEENSAEKLTEKTAAQSTERTLSFNPETFIAIQDQKSFDQLMKELTKYKEFVIDLETTSLNPREAKIVGVAIAYQAKNGFYIPLEHVPTLEQQNLKQLESRIVLQTLKPLLENPQYKKIGHNLKYDFSVLLENGIQADGIGSDTMVADYVLNPEGRHGLDQVILRTFNYQMLSFEEVCGKGKDQITFDQVPIERATRYAAEDAWVTFNLYQEQLPLLNSRGLMRVYAEVDLPLVQVLRDMECEGVKIDENYLLKLSKEFHAELKILETKIEAYTRKPVNLNSPKQLQELLFTDLKLPVQTKTKTGYSTDASVLEILAPLHPVPKLILEYREIQKLLSTYIDPLPLLQDPKTKRIHAGFHQTVTATGRLSSSDPNLQNIPIRTERGQKIRQAFIPREGYKLLSADYSQIELRLLAQMSNDPDLVDSFNKDQDVHRRTAQDIYALKTPDEVSDQQRSVAKAINFGLMYGKTAFGLAEELGITRTEAKEMIERYFKRYSGVKTFLDSLILQAKENSQVETLLGRVRPLPDIHAKNPMIRANAERMAMNTPIQGTAADLMKLAMIRLHEKLKGFKTKMIIQVHDEIVLEVKESEEEEVKKIVKTELERAFDGVVDLRVPLKANLAVGLNWMDL